MQITPPVPFLLCSSAHTINFDALLTDLIKNPLNFSTFAEIYADFYFQQK